MDFKTYPTLLLAAMAMAGPVAAGAQVATVPSLVSGPVRTSLGVAVLDDLDARFRAGDLEGTERLAREIVQAAGSAGLDADACDLARNHVALVWVAANPDGRLVLRRLHLPYRKGRPYALDLPGVSCPGGSAKLYELFVSADVRASLASAYLSTREEDALVPLVPTMAETVLGPFFALAAGLAGEVQAAETLARQGALPEKLPAERASLVLHVSAARVVLPFDRASVKATSVASVPVSVQSFSKAATALAQSLRFQQVPDAACGRAFAERLASVAAGVAATEACTSPTAATGTCLAAFDQAFAEARKASAGECATRYAGKGGKAASTDDGAAAQLPAAEERAMALVDSKFRDLVAESGPERVEATTAFRNKPLDHFAFGLGAGIIVAARVSRPRVREDGGVIVSDPLSRQLSIAYVNWSPTGYDTDADRPSPAERFRPFAGAILTPDLGVGAGMTVVAVRGLGVNVGGGLLFTRAPRSRDSIGSAPDDAKRPFSMGVAPVFFVGAGYAFR